MFYQIAPVTISNHLHKTAYYFGAILRQFDYILDSMGEECKCCNSAVKHALRPPMELRRALKYGHRMNHASFYLTFAI